MSHQLEFACIVHSGRDHAGLHARVLRQHGGDLSGLDAHAADLDLIVKPPGDHELPVGAQVSSVTGEVQQVVGIVAERIAAKARPVFFGH